MDVDHKTTVADNTASSNIRSKSRKLISTARESSRESLLHTPFQGGDSTQADGSRVSLTVEDNGIGIGAGPLKNGSGGHGLMIMRERAEAVGGTFNFSSKPGKGTRIEVNVEVASDRLQEAKSGVNE